MHPTDVRGPDPRWQNLVGDRAELEEKTGSWPVSPALPEGVSEVLRVSRELFVHSYFVYEFSLTAVVWGLLALEASLRLCVKASDRESLQALIRRASDSGLLSVDEASALNGARELRNEIVHGSLLPTFAPTAAAEMLEAIHEAISDVCERTFGEGVSADASSDRSAS